MEHFKKVMGRLKKNCSVLLMAILAMSVTMGMAESGEFSASVEGKKATLKTEGVVFSLPASPASILQINKKLNIANAIGDTARNFGMQRFNGNSVEDVNLAIDKENSKVVSLLCSKTFGPDRKFIDPGYQLELNLEIRKSLPCLFVKARLRNLREASKPAWNWYIQRAAISYSVNGKEMAEVPGGKWSNLGKEKWIYFTFAEVEGGIGFVFEQPRQFGCSKNKHPYLGDITPFLKTNEVVEEDIVIFSAKDIEEARAIYKRLKEEPRQEESIVAISPSVGGVSLVKSDNEDKRTVEIKESDSSIKADGRLNEPAWEKAGMLSDFLNLKGKPAKEQTKAYLTYDEKNIYIGIEAKESRMEKVKAEITERDGRLWYDDCIELFINTNPGDIHYCHLVTNLADSLYDKKSLDFAPNDWNPEWKSASTKGKYGWTTEIVIPFKSLGYKTAPVSGTFWNINVCRERHADKFEASSWSWTKSGFHTPHLFGRLIFGTYKDFCKLRLSQISKRIDEKLKSIQEPCREVIRSVNTLQGRISGIEKRLEKKVKYSKLERRILDEDIANIEDISRRIRKGKANYIVWHKNPMIQLSQKDFPEDVSSDLKELKLDCAVGEYENEAFILTNLIDKTIPVRISLLPLKGERSQRMLFPNNITLREAIFIRIKDNRIIADALPAMNEAKIVKLTPPQI